MTLGFQTTTGGEERVDEGWTFEPPPRHGYDAFQRAGSPRTCRSVMVVEFVRYPSTHLHLAFTCEIGEAALDLPVSSKLCGCLESRFLRSAVLTISHKDQPHRLANHSAVLHTSHVLIAPLLVVSRIKCSLIANTLPC